MQRNTAALIAGGVVMSVIALGWLASKKRRPPLDTVSSLDLERYVGTWFEIARLPFRSEEGCVEVTARYFLQGDGTVTVVNRCIRKDGVDEATGRAWRPDESRPGRLKVRFFWPFTGDYNVLAQEGYRYALVGSRNRRYAWLLSRDPTMPEEVRMRFETELERQGFDTSLLADTPQG